MIRVLHVCDKFGVAGSSIHGVSRLFSWWFPRFDASRFEVKLVGLKRREPATDALAAQGVPVEHLGRSRFDPRLLGDLTEVARRHRAQVLHVHGYGAANFGRLTARRVGAALVLHEHFADPAMPWYQAVADRLLSGLTDRAVAVSESTRRFLVEQRHVPADRVELVWNGAPLRDFEPPSRERALAARASVGLSPAASVVGVVGRLSLQKGHRHLLDAMAQVLPTRPDVRLLVVGDGDQESPLRAQAERLGISDRVVFAGHRTDVSDLLGAMDVLCLPSLYEGTPLVLFEAMAAARPIVSTAVDGCAEVLEHERTGLLVPRGEARPLAEALTRVLDDRALRERLAAAARDASRRYDVASCVSRLESLYEELAGSRP